MTKCEFGSDESIKYTNPVTGQMEPYHCPIDVDEQGLCLFHNVNTSQVPDDNQIADLIFKSTLGKIGLFIGFHLKNFNLTNIRGIPILFQDVQFYDEANFQDIQMGESVDFKGCKFHKYVKFEKCTAKNIEFERVNFYKGMKFLDCSFIDANFYNTDFYETVEYVNCGINDVFFSDVKFLESWTLDSLNYPKEQKQTRFSVTFKRWKALNTEFHNQVDCTSSTLENIKFDECHFFKSVGLRYATIRGSLIFKESTFDGKVDFFKAKLEECKEIDFTESEFKGEIEMSGLKIAKLYIHKDPKAYDLSYYTIKTVLNGKANFTKSSFKELYLFNAIFEQQPDFMEASFGKVRTNSNTTFRNGVNFERAVFEEELEFHGVFFPSGNDQIKVNFDSADFKKRIKFTGQNIRKMDLSCTSFKGTDLKMCEFNNVNWLQKEDKISKLTFLKRNVVIDELLLDKNRNYEEVSKIYYGLRKNYESRLFFNEASPFFIGEMECKRKDKKSLDSIGYKIYKWLAFYGESVKMPLGIWTPTIIVLFALGRLIPEYVPPKDLITQGLSPEDLSILKCSILDITRECFHNSFIDSLSAFFQFPRANYTLDILERIISAPILGTAFIALKRKFERNK